MSGSVDFLINIQQRMQGSAVTELQKLDQQLNAAKASYAQMAAAAANASKRSEVHAAATEGVRGKLKDAMDSGDDKGAAKHAAALSKMSAKNVELRARSDEASSALKKQEAVVEKLADQRGGAKRAEELAKGLEQVGEHGEGGMRRLTGAFRFLGGPVGRTGALVSESIGKFRILTKQFGVTRAGAIGLAAIVAIAYTKILEGAFALGEFAIKSADASRDMGLTVKALLGGGNAGDVMSSAMRNVADETGVGADRLLEITRAMRKAKISADAMPNALRAVAIQESALGDTEGTDLLIARLAGAKTAAGTVADEMDTKFGGIVQQKMLGLSQQAATFQRHLVGLVSGFNIEPLLAGLKTLVDLFDENTAAGAAMKDLFHSVFEPLLEAAERSIHPIRRFILGLVLGVRMFEVSIDPIASAIATAFDSGPLSKFGDAGDAGIETGSLLAGTLLAMAVIAGVAIAMIALPFQLIAGAIETVQNSIEAVKAAWSAFADWWDGLDFAALANALIDGLTNGIKAGGEKVANAVIGLGEGAIASFQKAIGAHSPSTKFEHWAYMMPLGVVRGVDKGTDMVGDAVDRMVDIPGEKVMPLGGGGSSRMVKIEKIEINGVKDANDILDRIGDEVMVALEGAMVELGLDVTGDEAIE